MNRIYVLFIFFIIEKGFIAMFLLIFNQLMKMLLIMAAAFICYRIKLINQEGNRNFSNLLLMIVNPCLIITVYQTDYNSHLIQGLLIAFLLAIASHMIGIVISHFAFPKHITDFEIERFTSIYSNCGFMGIPIVNSVLGSEGVFYLTAYISVFNFLSWTHGTGLLIGKFSRKNLKQGLLSPMILATAGGLILFFLQIRLPEIFIDSLNYIASMNTPLAMIVAGLSVAQADLKKIFINLRILKVSMFRLLAIPFAVLLLFSFLPVNHRVTYPILIASACPCATTGTMMSIRFNKNYTYSSEIVSVSTVLSILTIPIVTYFSGFLL
ncbi:MAG: AEC family transporter [Schaedlerella sp.]|nr:AEC family transporter [Schaedlerella sp.]